MKVLFIEPDELAGELYSSILKAKNLKVSIAKTAQSALFQVDDFNPDCIIMELDLKLHNGLEFLYEFCSQYDWKEIPIILHTQVSPDRISNMTVSMEELGVSRYLYKPQTTLEELQNCVLEVLAENVKYS